MADVELGPEAGGSYSLYLGDYDPGAPVSLLLEIVLPPWDEGIYRMAQAMLVWDDPGEAQQRHNLRQDVVVQAASLATARLDGRVMNIVERVGAFKMSQQAMQAAQAAVFSVDGDGRDQATVRLRQAATRLLDMGEAELANTMLLQAQALELSGRLDPEATKKFRYETRRLAQNP
jgi:Ca-activated chloride channel family protein